MCADDDRGESRSNRVFEGFFGDRVVAEELSRSSEEGDIE